VRRLSPVERVWLAADRLCPPFVNQLVLEGDGVPDEAAWRAASGPGLVLRGVLGGCRWVPGPAAPVRTVDGSAWDGFGPDGAPFLRDPLPPSGPTCEVLLAPGRVVFRSHHAVMDGRGTLVWVDDVFRALRGEAVPALDVGVTDLDLARPGPPARRRDECPAPTGRAVASEGVTWRRRTVAGPVAKVLPRVVHTVGTLALRQGAPVRIGVPVDLRRDAPSVRSTANLTGMVFVPVGRGDSVEDVARALEALVPQAGLFVHEAAPLRGIPLAVMAWAGRRGAARALRLGRYGASAAVSNLGRLDLAAFHGGGFRARRAFFIPPGNPAQPFFLALAGHPEGVELVATTPAALATDGRLDAALDFIARSLA
jgi:hypothetical protein